MMILKLLLILLLCALNAEAGSRRGPNKSRRPAPVPTKRPRRRREIREDRRETMKDVGPRVIPSYVTESQDRYYAFGSGVELKSWGGNYYQMEDECEERGDECWGFQTTFGCADRLGCGQALILSDPGNTRKISVPGTTVYRKADVPWYEETDRCNGLWKDWDAAGVGECEQHCRTDPNCLVYQWMSDNACWRGKPSSCCPQNNNQYPDWKVLEGYRKPNIQFVEFLTQCQGLDWDRHVNSAANCEANCELDSECEVWQFYNNRNDCWRGKKQKCHGDRPADSGGYKTDAGVCDRTLERCCSYNTKWGLIPGETWGSTPEEAKGWHTRNNCDTLMGGSELTYCPYTCDMQCAGQKRQCDHTWERCCSYNTNWGLIPWITWGSTPEAEKEWFSSTDCNTLMGGSELAYCPYTCDHYDPPSTHDYSIVMSMATCASSFYVYGQDAVATPNECEALCDSRDDCDTYCFSNNAGGEWECLLYSSCAIINSNQARWESYTCKSKGNYEFLFSHVGHCAEGWMGSNTFQRSLKECSEECSAREGSQFFAFCDENPQDCDNGLNCACFNDNSCFDDGQWNQFKAYEIGECARTKAASCWMILDKEICLSRVEERNVELNGVQIQGSECVWCPNGPCTENFNRCEPKIWLDTMPNSGYDMCLSDLTHGTPQEYTTLFSSEICADQFYVDQWADSSEEECQELCDWRMDCETYCYSSEKLLCLLYTGCTATAFNDGLFDSYTCHSNSLPPVAHDYSTVVSGATCASRFNVHGQDEVATAAECESLCDSRDDCDTYCFSHHAGDEKECMLYSSCAGVDPNQDRWGTYTCKSQGNYEFLFSHVGHCEEGWMNSNTFQWSLKECSEYCSRGDIQFFTFCDRNPQDCDKGMNCACFNDDSCFDDGNWKQFKAYEIGECARTETAECWSLSDELSCLQSVESRSLELNGVQLHGSNCVWCPNGPCTSNNENRCEPQIWLDTMPHSGYDTCLSDFPPTPAQEYSTLFSSAICADQFWIDQTLTDTSEDECQELCDWRNDCETYCYSSEQSSCLLYTGCSVTEPAFNDGTPAESYTCKSNNPPPTHEYSTVLSGATCGYSFVAYGQDAVATADECEFLCDSRDDCDTYCFSSDAGGEWECMLYSSCASVDPNTARWGTYTCKSQGNYEFFFSHAGHCAEGWDGSNTFQRSLEQCSEECSAREGSQFFTFCDSNPQDCDNGMNCACFNDDMCTDDGTFKQYKAYEIGECARTETAACDGIFDKLSCLSSVESRSLELNGVQLNGSNCVWCPNGACTSDNENRCEPQIWLDTMPHSGYETCLSDVSSGNPSTGSRLILSPEQGSEGVTVSKGRRHLRSPKL